MAKRLPVPYRKQRDVGYCLAACAQMGFAFQDVFLSQDVLAKKMNVKPALDAPTRHIQKTRLISLSQTAETMH
jgi:hypothetical protein